MERPLSPDDEILMPPGLRRRRSVRNAVTLVPPLVAGFASFALGGLEAEAAARGAVLAVAILATAGLLRNFPYPVRLMPASRAFLAVAPVLAGAFVAGMLAVSDAYGLAATSLIPATLLAIAAAIAVEYVGGHLLARRPLRVAVLGSPDFAAGLQRELEADGVQPVVVVGWLNLGATPEVSGGTLQIGTLDSIRAAVTEHEIDLLVRGPSQSLADGGRHVYDAIAQGCVDLPVRMITGNQLYEQLFGHVPLGKIDSDWFLFLMHPSFESTARLPKRGFDLVTSLAASIVALPLIAIAAIAIKLEDRGPVFYRQTRVGEGGRSFEIVKLRTMSADAEDTGAQWSVAADERVTRVGRVLRRSHVDELPQLFNVLRGEMTMVGPRPERPEIIGELEHLFPHYKRRLLVKPGVTGWAQVRCGYAGSELGTAWKLCHDLFYLKHRGLLSDSLIMLETMLIAAKDSHRPIRAPLPEFLVDSERLEISAAAGSSFDHEPDDGWATDPVPEISLDGGHALRSGTASFAMHSPPAR